MNILSLVKENDPILKTETQKFDFNSGIDPIEIAKNLTETMIANNGLGLSANQVGLPYRVCAITGNTVRVMFNPRIVNVSDEQVVMEEGCLSFPGLLIKVKRPATVKVRYTQPNNQTVTEEFAGLTARVVLHELDHLDGITYIDKATRFHLEQARKKRAR